MVPFWNVQIGTRENAGGGVKNCHIWAYALFEWPLNDPLRGIFYKKTVYFYLIQKLFSWTFRYCNWALGKLPQEKCALPPSSPLPNNSPPTDYPWKITTRERTPQNIAPQITAPLRKLPPAKFSLLPIS